MTKKMKKQGGFTLVEMLIVVAIIAILIAVSIPLVAGALEKAREATDAANERSFKAVLVTGYLLNDAGLNNGIKIEASTDTDEKIYYFDAVNGVAKDAVTGIKPYGQSDATGDVTDVVPKGKILQGKIKADGTVEIGWGATDNKLVSNQLIDSTTP